MQRAAVNDGLAGLSDIEIHHKARDVPTKIKAHLRQLNLWLKKQGVVLNQNGDLDFSNCENPKQVEAVYKKNPTIAWIALMLRDLEYEYPMKLERLELKANLLELIEEEEWKFLDTNIKEKVAEIKRKELIYEDRTKDDVEVLKIDQESKFL